MRRSAQMQAPLNNVDGSSMLQNMDSINSLLARTGTILPMDWATMQPDAKQQFLDSLEMKAQTAGDVAGAIDENAQQQEDLLGNMQQMGVEMSASKKVFNLKKYSQLNPTMSPAPVPPAAPVPQQGLPSFSSGADVKTWLDGMEQQDHRNASNKAITLLSSEFTNENQSVTDPDTNASGEALGVIKDCVSGFFSTADQQERLKAASLLFDTIMPDGAKHNKALEDGSVPAKFDSNVHASKIVAQTNDYIKKLAQADALAHSKTASKKFNLKTAQHQSIQNMMMFGPGQNHVDAFTGQLISDWHLVERNKGYGLKLDGVYNVDWESVWRGTVMDKYSRPYKDKEGNWVGGYLSRFETDRNQPVQNQMQLKPGEKRKPRLPEYGTISSRLEAAREAGATGSDPTKFFNLKKARAAGFMKKTAAMTCEGCGLVMAEDYEDSKCPTCICDDDKKKVTEAQVKPLQPIGELPNEGLKLPGDAEPGKAANPICNKCGGNLAKGVTGWMCPNCNNSGAPDYMPGHQQSQPHQQQPGGIQMNQRMGSGIFYSGGHFVVHASEGKREFKTFEAAEKFAQALPQPNPVQDVAPVPTPVRQQMKQPVARPKPPLSRHEIEKAQAADKLGIDG